MTLAASTHRSYLLGLAMTAVLIYHFGIWILNPFGWLNVGYVGVDLFLFFSGAGLVRSFAHHDLRRFYMRRFSRIYPLYTLTTIVTLLIGAGQYTEGSRILLDAVSRLTTLAFYIPSMQSVDWYLSSLFAFYLLFPLLYSGVRRWGFGFYLLILALTVMLVCALSPLHWRYDCPLSRLPVFVLGITCATHSYTPRQTRLFALACLPLVCLLLPYSPFLSWSFAAPILIVVGQYAARLAPSKAIDAIGRHSLAFYCANLVVEALLPFGTTWQEKALIYLIVQSLCTPVFILTDKCMQQWLQKRIP